MSGSRARVDAREKVMGAALFAADRVPDGLLHAALATATVDRGRIAALDTSRAEAVPGVRLVLTRLGEDELRPAGFLMADGFAFQSLQPLTTDRIAYRGQPVALVVADDPVAAAHAAELVEARYDAEPHAVTIDDPGATVVLQQEAIPLPFLADIVVGDADAELARADVTVDAVYEHPAQNSAPMELIGAVVHWRGDTLVVHEGTQNASSIRYGLARQLGIDAERIEVVSPYTGGGFGQKNSLQPHIGPLAVAARRLGRPVKLVLSRPQVFHQASFRPVSRHRIAVGADRDGRLLAAVHEADQQTSRHDLFPAMFTDVTSRLYGFGAFRGRQRLVQTDVQTPGYMRAPFEHPGAWAMECAVDELANAAGRDPVELRLANDTTQDPVTGRPFSSRYVAECLTRGAELFGWGKRRPEPATWTAADGAQVGWGVAIGAYPVATTPAVARAVAYPDGRFGVEVDGHEMGQGIRSAIALLVADLMGVPVDRVSVGLGDTRVAAQHLTAGSWGTSSALPAVHAAVLKLRETLGGRAPAGGPVAVSASNGLPQPMLERARTGLVTLAGPVYDDFVAFSFIAHFVEVRVEAGTRRIRVPRVVSVADCGRVASHVTAASQVRGGVVWGLGAALRERLEVDERYGGFVNATLEEYPLTVNADVGRIDVEFVDRPDRLLNPVGVKGLGEVSLVGVAAAVANAVFHATGRRVRHLPITLADLL
ncbi:xanthine dehydrogenase family protein molybdopterin-binding subunit [Dactylosporangium sp. CA-139066]|uniref:xanthine dehydrogenase family protein molybdopterin-binding subunit n=1 Tax=Dactylosporangium sp. CA-139066 TaxID=3239930 RepID=UPI003D8AFA51